MGHKVTLGGDRLGSGKKNKILLHGFNRSTHNLGNIFQSTMACGTLVPIMSKVALPGDSFEINLNADVKTLPTLGPLFGSYKLQVDFFQVPIRLYQAALHNNMLDIGRDMSKIKLPQLTIQCKNLDLQSDEPIELQQINQSALLAYLGIRGVGYNNDLDANATIKRIFNGIPYLAYWDIYKNYYANKQEEIGAFINYQELQDTWSSAHLTQTGGGNTNVRDNDELENYIFGESISSGIYQNVTLISVEDTDYNKIFIQIKLSTESTWTEWLDLSSIDGSEFASIQIDGKTIQFIGAIGGTMTEGFNIRVQVRQDAEINKEIKIDTFPLKNIDDMRTAILAKSISSPFNIDMTSAKPYGTPLTFASADNEIASKYSQVGLGLKTYQSDLFNNWLNTEWIDGTTGVNEISKVDVSEGYLKIDSLNLAQKIYKMLNRIAVSGGSYYDYIEAQWDVDPARAAETPIYVGGLSKEVVFQQVVSTAATADEPLGSLAGQGRMSGKHKGGRMTIKIKNEPCYIIGIVSLTPRLVYSQGNNWDVNLKTIADLHVPMMDGIGFQELITDQLAFWNTKVDANGTVTTNSVGKQPAWINYMTEVNKAYGNFADPRNQMFMTLNRRYKNDDAGNIEDLTSYIDPTKYNYVFAQQDISAQNFWVQVGMDVTARRLMSAQVMPNL